MTAFACAFCDHERTIPGLQFCTDCEEVTDTYVVNRDGYPGEVYTNRVDFSKVDLRPAEVRLGFEREAHAGLISLGEDRRAA